MAFVNLDIADIFKQVFNYKSEAFEFADKPARNTNGNLKGSPYYKNNSLGREYFLPVNLKYKGTFEGVSYDINYDLPNPVLSIDNNVHTVETPLVEIQGSVAEIIAIESYVVHIRGVLVGIDGNFPEGDINQLRKIVELPVAFEISNPVTDIFLQTIDRKGYDKVIRNGFRLIPVQGTENICGYEFVFKSDHVFTLIEE